MVDRAATKGEDWLYRYSRLFSMSVNELGIATFSLSVSFFLSLVRMCVMHFHDKELSYGDLKFLIFVSRAQQ